MEKDKGKTSQEYTIDDDDDKLFSCPQIFICIIFVKLHMNLGGRQYY